MLPQKTQLRLRVVVVMADCSIVRIGPITGTDDCGATFLRDAILRHFQRVDGGGANDNDQSASLTISNRYFTANVALLGLDETISYDNLSSGSNDNGSSISTTVEEDGILLVFDDRSSHSFDSLGHIHDTFVVPSAIGDLLRMCIGTHASTDNDVDGYNTASIIDKDEYSRRVLWCLDRGYEYVSVDLSTRGMTTGFDVRDKDGYARVIEAIETCMWSCRIMKSSPDGAVQSSSVVQQRAKGFNGDSVAGINNKIDDTGVTMSDTTIIPLMTDDEREKAAIASLMKGVANGDGNGDYIPPSLDEDGESMRRQQQQQQREEEISFHQLEKVLTEAKSIREASRSNANMSDEERRARAGDAAMKLMGLLDRLGFDDNDDDEDVDDCDSDDRELTGS
jgi:hypothetical protein